MPPHRSRHFLKWTPTPDSETMTRFGYDASHRTLGVEFRHGGLYHYLKVPEGVHREMKAAESKGRFLTERIKDRYPFIIVDW